MENRRSQRSTRSRSRSNVPALGEGISEFGVRRSAFSAAASVQQVLPNKLHRRVKLVVRVLFLSEAVSFILG